MKEIYLRNKNLVTLVDDDVYETLGSLAWYAWSRPGMHTWYVLHGMQWGGKVKQFRLHREILEAPPGVEVDHINGDGLDNRRENLRFSNRQGNNCNKPAYKTNTSGYKGVSLHRKTGGWVAQIQVNKMKRALGIFPTPELAHAAYCKAAAELHGEFARVDCEGWSR